MSDNIQKLVVECRIEAGCLGPSGADHVVDFCEFANSRFSIGDDDHLSWQVVPRDNAEQAEVQYMLAGKKLSMSQAIKYLSMIGIERNELEAQIDERLVTLIEQYFD